MLVVVVVVLLFSMMVVGSAVAAGVTTALGGGVSSFVVVVAADGAAVLVVEGGWSVLTATVPVLTPGKGEQRETNHQKRVLRCLVLVMIIRMRRCRYVDDGSYREVIPRG